MVREFTLVLFNSNSENCTQSVKIKERSAKKSIEQNDYNQRENFATQENTLNVNETPELPDRNYLQDIDFVSQEFDLILKRPELPEREYLEDIDFVAQEFDLILKRPPSIPCRLAEKGSGKSETDGIELRELQSNENQVMNQSTVETSHYMALLKTAQENDDISNVYQSLKPERQTPHETIVEIHGGGYPHNNTYQSLIAIKEDVKSCDSGHYQSLSLKKASP